MTTPNLTQGLLSAALAALFATDDAMPESEHSIAVYTHLGVAVVLLDTVAAWAAWVVALQARHEGPVSAQAGLHVTTAEGCVCGCPVMLVTGDYVPSAVAA